MREALDLEEAALTVTEACKSLDCGVLQQPVDDGMILQSVLR